MISNGKKFMKCLVDCISLMLFYCDDEREISSDLQDFSVPLFIEKSLNF